MGVDQQAMSPAKPPTAPRPLETAAALEDVKVVIHDGVRFIVKAEPQEGKLYVKGKAYPVGSEVILSPGYYSLYFEGPNWSSACKTELHERVRVVHFNKGQSGCRLD